MIGPRLQEAILTLYRGSGFRRKSVFKRWAMDAVRPAVPFDSGIWVTSDVSSKGFFSTHRFRHPPAPFYEDQPAACPADDFLSQAAISNPGRTIRADDVVPRHEFIRHPYYLQHCRQHGIEHALCTWHLIAGADVPTCIAFYRSDPETPFSESDRQITELLVPHLVEAMRINLFGGLIGWHSEHVRCGGTLALCDSSGRLFEATTRFVEMLRDAWPAWVGPLIPLPSGGLSDDRTVRWEKDGLAFVADPCRDLFLVGVIQERVPDSMLSARQREVMELLVKGKSYKNISEELGIASATVKIHVSQIYARFGVRGREALIVKWKKEEMGS